MIGYDIWSWITSLIHVYHSHILSMTMGLQSTHQLQKTLPNFITLIRNTTFRLALRVFRTTSSNSLCIINNELLPDLHRKFAACEFIKRMLDSERISLSHFHLRLANRCKADINIVELSIEDSSTLEKKSNRKMEMAMAICTDQFPTPITIIPYTPNRKLEVNFHILLTSFAISPLHSRTS